jgi:hypothetical protein
MPVLGTPKKLKQLGYKKGTRKGKTIYIKKVIKKGLKKK